MDKAERVVALEEARELIAEALGMIREATEEDAHVEAYLCAPLSLIVDEGLYVSHDITIAWVIERINEDDIEGDDDNNMADIDDERGRGYGDQDKCTGCESALNIAPPCQACSKVFEPGDWVKVAPASPGCSLEREKAYQVIFFVPPILSRPEEPGEVFVAGERHGVSAEHLIPTAQPGCTGCGSALNIAPPCSACGDRLCQDCSECHICDPE